MTARRPFGPIVPLPDPSNGPRKEPRTMTTKTALDSTDREPGIETFHIKVAIEVEFDLDSYPAHRLMAAVLDGHDRFDESLVEIQKAVVLDALQPVYPSPEDDPNSALRNVRIAPNVEVTRADG